MKLAAIVCLCLASKYQERITFKISHLAKTLKIASLEDLAEEDFRKIEFEILRLLEFRIGGEQSFFERITFSV